MKTINTNNQLVDLATALGVTFDTGKIYTLQISGTCSLKLDNFDEFTYHSNDLLNYDASKGTLYIRTTFFPCAVSIVSSADV